VYSDLSPRDEREKENNTRVKSRPIVFVSRAVPHPHLDLEPLSPLSPSVGQRALAVFGLAPYGQRSPNKD
jgi:hypothetical protein